MMSDLEKSVIRCLLDEPSNVLNLNRGDFSTQEAVQIYDAVNASMSEEMKKK